MLGWYVELCHASILGWIPDEFVVLPFLDGNHGQADQKIGLNINKFGTYVLEPDVGSQNLVLEVLQRKDGE